MEYKIKKIEVIESRVDYFIDNLGGVFSSYGSKNGELRKMKPKLDKYGYYIIGLRNIEGKKKFFTIHRLVAIHFLHNDNPKDKTTVNHINNIKTDNRVENLEWMSQADNNRYRFKMGYQVNGKSITIFSDEDARDIITLFYIKNIPRTIVKSKYLDKYSRQSIESLLCNRIRCFQFIFDEMCISQEEIIKRKGQIDSYRKQEIYNALYEYLSEHTNKKEICIKYNMSQGTLNRYLKGDDVGCILEKVKQDMRMIESQEIIIRGGNAINNKIQKGI